MSRNSWARGGEGGEREREGERESDKIVVSVCVLACFINQTSMSCLQ